VLLGGRIFHPSTAVVLIAAAGDKAAWRFIEFFIANIRNRTPAPPMAGLSLRSARGAKRATRTFSA
jgi:hypothetical protein